MQKLLDPKVGAFVLSVFVVAAFIAVLSYAMIYGVKDNPTLSLLTGAQITAFTTVIQYWLGSSSSSKGKDDVIARQADLATSGGQPTATVNAPTATTVTQTVEPAK